MRGAEKNSVFVGDFNLPRIDRGTGGADGRDARFVLAVQDSFMEQLFPFPTHTKGNCLDLVITNCPKIVKEVTDVGRLGKSDHVMLELSIAIGENKQLEKVSVKNWKKADWDKIREKLRNTTWPTTEDELTADEAWGALRNTLYQLIEEHVPSCIFNPFVTRKKSA